MNTLFTLSNLHPGIVTSQQRPPIGELAAKFPQIVPDVGSVESEWNALSFVQFSAENLSDTVTFWSHVASLTNAANEQRYGNVSN